MLQNFNQHEKMQSSTLHRGSYAHSLNSMITRFKSKNLYWQTDNVATTSIIGSGSNKVKLQNMALEIYDLTCNNNISLNIESILY